MNRKLLAPTFALAFTACYGAAPGRPPRIPLPELADAPDAHLTVHTETKTQIENVQKQASTCPAGHSAGDPLCTVTNYEVAEPVTRTKSTIDLDSQPINYAQFSVMTDPKWNAKLARIDELSQKCQRANTPRYIGMGAFAVGLLVGPFVAKASAPVGDILIVGGIGGGTASYIAGYVAFGGRHCVEAQQMFDAMNLTREMGWNTVEGQDRANEMHELAEQFNAVHGGSRASRASEPAADPVIEIEPTKPVKAKPIKTKKKKPAATLSMR